MVRKDISTTVSPVQTMETDRQTEDRAGSLCLYLFFSDVGVYTGLSQTDCYSLGIHTHTNNDALYCSQTSVTSEAPDFTRNQLRLSKKRETYPPPPPPCPSSDFISTFLQLFIPFSFLFLLYCHDFVSPPLLFKRIYFLSSPGQRGDRRAIIISCS